MYVESGDKCIKDHKIEINEDDWAVPLVKKPAFVTGNVKIIPYSYCFLCRVLMK